MANAHVDLEKPTATKSKIRPIRVCKRPAWILDIVNKQRRNKKNALLSA